MNVLTNSIKPQIKNDSSFRTTIIPMWKPSASQQEQYAKAMAIRATLPVFTTSKAIRKGCKVKFFCINKATIVEGTVLKHSYGKEKNQHTFSILWNETRLLIKGRNLYPNMLEHIQGEESKLISK